MKTVFVNYGGISSNSGIHIRHFARELKGLGHEVIIVNFKNKRDLDEADDDITLLSYDQFWRCLNAAEGRLDISSTLLHAWTPRENVRSFVDKISSRWKLPYLVHLEDNETSITAARLGVSSGQLLRMSPSKLRKLVPPAFSNPHEMRVFLRRALGLTIITPSLTEFCPPDKKRLVLEPGVDHQMFRPISSRMKGCIRREFGLSSGESYVVYPGNTHVVNERDVDSLYQAVNYLRSKGRRLVLIRTGRDYRQHDGTSLRREDWLVELGFLDRTRLLKVLQIADFFVQPGGVDEFNAYRLPSKIPECLAMARPVILPQTNIGLRMTQNKEAVLMSTGGSEEIASKLELLMDDPSLAAHIGVNGRKFAIANFSWSKSARALSEFYASVYGDADSRRSPWPLNAASLYRRFADRIGRWGAA